MSCHVGRACSCCIYIQSLGVAWFTGPAAPQHPGLELVLRRMSHDILFSSARFWHISPENAILMQSRAIYKRALFRRYMLQYIASCRLELALIRWILLQYNLGSSLISIRWLYIFISYLRYHALVGGAFSIPHIHSQLVDLFVATHFDLLFNLLPECDFRSFSPLPFYLPLSELYMALINYCVKLFCKSFLIPVNLSDTRDFIRKKSTRLIGGQARGGVWFGALQKREGDWCLHYPLDETQIPKRTFLNTSAKANLWIGRDWHGRLLIEFLCEDRIAFES